eukprot:6726352-Ditylum_brightwellii.AAC.1
MTKTEYLPSVQAGKKKANHILQPSTTPSNSTSNSNSRSNSNSTSKSNSNPSKTPKKSNEKQPANKNPTSKPFKKPSITLSKKLKGQQGFFSKPNQCPKTGEQEYFSGTSKAPKQRDGLNQIESQAEEAMIKANLAKDPQEETAEDKSARLKSIIKDCSDDEYCYRVKINK